MAGREIEEVLIELRRLLGKDAGEHKAETLRPAQVQ
jgi:hypothetical protein